ncbi:hypothetical protein REPUB_Repub09cG0109700 [Reevesia pubescens]
MTTWVLDSNIAELLAINTALHIFCSSSWFKKNVLIIVSNSKVAILWVCNSYSKPWMEWKIFDSIDRCREKTGQVDFAHVLQEANSFADALAKMGVDR